MAPKTSNSDQGIAQALWFSWFIVVWQMTPGHPSSCCLVSWMTRQLKAEYTPACPKPSTGTGVSIVGAESTFSCKDEATWANINEIRHSPLFLSQFILLFPQKGFQDTLKQDRKSHGLLASDITEKTITANNTPCGNIQNEMDLGQNRIHRVNRQNCKGFNFAKWSDQWHPRKVSSCIQMQRALSLFVCLYRRILGVMSYQTYFLSLDLSLCLCVCPDGSITYLDGFYVKVSISVIAWLDHTANFSRACQRVGTLIQNSLVTIKWSFLTSSVNQIINRFWGILILSVWPRVLTKHQVDLVLS